MFGLSFAELAVIILVIVVVFGPDKLPEVARLISKGYREVRKLSNSVRDAFAIEDDFRDGNQRFKYVVEEPQLSPNKGGGSSLDYSPKPNMPQKEEDVAKTEIYAVKVPSAVNLATLERESDAVRGYQLPLRGEGESHREVDL